MRMTDEQVQASGGGADALRRKLRTYVKPDTSRSLYEVGITIVPFAVTWALMAYALQQGLIWLYLLGVAPAAGFLVRLFLIQHDCGHGSFFQTRAANDWTGRILGVLTLTDYDHWRRSHAVHHATSGNLDHRGVGDIDTLTVTEFRARSRWGRLRYRAYRHPLVMFGLGPAYVFILQGRLPVGFMRKGRELWISTMATNAAIVLITALMIWAVGAERFFLIQGPVSILGASVGVWLFFVQHQFEQTHWQAGDAWNASDAALHGSSHYDLPGPLRWLTANIGVHHVHHLASRIPFYRLSEVLRDFPELRNVGRLTLVQSLSCVPLTLWDEASQRLISFRDLRRAAA